VIGRLIERRRARRAAQATARLRAEHDAQLRAAADLVISRARRALTDRMPSLPLAERLTDREWVTVADVQGEAAAFFGLVAVDPGRAAAALRARYELRSGGMDLLTDAYGDQYREVTGA